MTSAASRALHSSAINPDGICLSLFITCNLQCEYFHGVNRFGLLRDCRANVKKQSQRDQVLGSFSFESVACKGCSGVLWGD